MIKRVGRTMKVLLINSVCGVGSTGRICTDIAAEFEKRGHEVKIAYGRDTVSESNARLAIRIGTTLDNKISALHTRITDGHGFSNKKATSAFLKWAEEYDPQMLWLHNIHGYYINVEMLFKWIKTRPQMKVFWTLHDCWSFTGHCAYFTVQDCDKWQTKCEKCPLKHEYPSSILLSRSESNFERKKGLFTGVADMTIITPSYWLADLVKKSFLKEYPVKVIHNGIDTSVFKPTPSDIRARYGLEDKKIIIGVAQVWNNRKGLGDFIKLSEMLDDTYKIVLVGLTDKQVSELPEKILGITRTKNATELAQWYTAADLFVNTTYEDNYPTVNLEAQACGTPAVTYRTGGSPESIPVVHVVEPGDLAGMAALIKNICESEIPAEILESEKYDRKGLYSEYVDAYKEDSIVKEQV
jgi:glycosyltransferase involved in cell wall biosynthesis